MPCNSDYLEANAREVWLSQVVQLHDEFNYGRPVDAKSAAWRGYDDRVYSKNVSKAEADQWVAALCQRFKECADVSKMSLEAQIWWRDHQKADAEREGK